MRQQDMTPTDARLVERAREGDAGAFETLVQRHYRPAFVVALGELRDAADAEDVCQDAFITALERLDGCRDPARFQAWLLQIVRNRARDVRRRQQVRLAQPLEVARRTADAADPALDFERLTLRERLLAALAELPDVQRQVVLMYDLEGWPHREIAEQLELKEGTVRSHLFHARRALRALLGADSLKEGADGTGTH
jgi:RNA polymerase sigma-70 factor, ECF subfamily